MLFIYKAITPEGKETSGAIEAFNVDLAISVLQKKGYTISQIHSSEEEKVFSFSILNRVSNKDVVMLSRQMATLFEAQVSALRIFRMLGAGVDNHLLQEY